MKLSTLYTSVNLPYVRVTDTKTSGTAGTSYASGAYRTVTINTENEDTDSICSVSSDQFTVPAGTYAVSVIGREPSGVTSNYAIRITNGGSTVIKWPSQRAQVDAGSRDYRNAAFPLTARIVLSASANLQLEIFTSATFSQSALSDGENEVYWMVELLKLD
jgi:hypothetical protein